MSTPLPKQHQSAKVVMQWPLNPVRSIRLTTQSQSGSSQSVSGHALQPRTVYLFAARAYFFLDKLRRPVVLLVDAETNQKRT